MPLGALQSCDVDYRAPVVELGSMLARLVQESAGPPLPIPPELGLEVEIALGRAMDSPTLSKIAEPAPLSCPQCGGVLSEVRSHPPLRFRCQVGENRKSSRQEGVGMLIVSDEAQLAGSSLRSRASLSTAGHTGAPNLCVVSGCSRSSSVARTYRPGPYHRGRVACSRRMRPKHKSPRPTGPQSRCSEISDRRSRRSIPEPRTASEQPSARPPTTPPSPGRKAG
jgi:hypothetical protein